MKHLFFFFAILLLSFTTFTSCEKSDPYIDWKVINDEWYNSNKNKLGELTESGVGFKRIGPEANPAERKPNPTDVVWINYTGKYIDGTTFDSQTNKPFSLLDVVTGLSEGILKMREGEKYEFIIPSNLGYGVKGAGAVPPYTTLIFSVELIRSQAN